METMLKHTIAALNWLKVCAGAATAPSGICDPDAVKIENYEDMLRGLWQWVWWYAREC